MVSKSIVFFRFFLIIYRHSDSCCFGLAFTRRNNDPLSMSLLAWKPSLNSDFSYKHCCCSMLYNNPMGELISRLFTGEHVPVVWSQVRRNLPFHCGQRLSEGPSVSSVVHDFAQSDSSQVVTRQTRLRTSEGLGYGCRDQAISSDFLRRPKLKISLL